MTRRPLFSLPRKWAMQLWTYQASSVAAEMLIIDLTPAALRLVARAA